MARPQPSSDATRPSRSAYRPPAAHPVPRLAMPPGPARHNPLPTTTRPDLPRQPQPAKDAASTTVYIEDDPFLTSSTGRKPSLAVVETPRASSVVGAARSVSKWDHAMEILGRRWKALVAWRRKNESTLRSVSKATLASLLCSIPVFIPATFEALGPAAHLSAVFFQPCRTCGSFFEMLLCSIALLTIITSLCCCALVSAAAYNASLGGALTSTDAGGAIILACFFCACMWLLGYIRSSFPRLNNPTMLCSIIVIFSLTNGNLNTRADFGTLANLLKPLLLGAAICTCVNLCYYPESGSRALRTLIRSTLMDVRDHIEVLVQAFCLKDGVDAISVEDLARSQRLIRAEVTKLQSLIWDASLEVSFGRFSPKQFDTLIRPLESLTKHLGAMQSVIKSEREMAASNPLLNPSEGADVTRSSSVHHRPSRTSISSSTPSRATSTAVAPTSPIAPTPPASNHPESVFADLVTPTSAHPSKPEILNRYVKAEGHLLRELADAATECLGHLVRIVEVGSHAGSRPPSPSHSRSASGPDMPGVEDDDERGEVEGEQCRGAGVSVPRLPPSLGPLAHSSSRSLIPADRVRGVEDCLGALSDSIKRLDEDQARYLNQWIVEEQGMPWREEVFLASYFEVSLREVALAVRNMTEVAVEMGSGGWKKGNRVWLPRVSVKDWLKTTDTFGIAKAMKSVRMDVPPHTVGKKSLVKDDWFGRLRFSGWMVWTWFRSLEVKYGTKLAITMMSVVWTAYVYPGFWQDYRAGWGVVTMGVVMSPTVGGSVKFTIYRVLGTIAGAVAGFLSWIAYPGNPFAILAFMTFFSGIFWYIFLMSPHARFGTTSLISMITITLITYEAYGLPGSENIWAVTYKRVATMLVGCMVAVISTTIWWPYIARIHARLDISKSLEIMGLLYTLLSVIITDETKHCISADGSDADGCDDDAAVDEAYVEQQMASLTILDADDEDTPEPRTATAKRSLARLHQEFKSLERGLQVALGSHEELIDLAATEPRLKCAYPAQTYRDVVKSMRTLLERMRSVRHLVGLGWSEELKDKVLKPLAAYRRDMIASILLTLHVISGSLTTLSPLPPIMPSTRAMRHRIINRLPALDVRDLDSRRTADEALGYMRYFAFALIHVDIISELETLTELVRSLVGQTTFPYLKKPAGQ
ncbi:hypothetical protein HK101_011862 [Irineochytrium annulatum]|nr:hypothetical protein HK101_011862 [Irineochytrium annulatum]